MSLYSLVLFVDDKGPNNVDIVPTDWIFYEKKDNHLHCPFIDDNPTTEESEYLRNLVINRDNPNENWNFHRIDVRGVADSYDEAIEKLSILKRKTHAFSTDNEDKVKQRLEEIKEKCRLKGKQKIDVKERLKSSYLDLSKPANKQKEKKKKQAKSSSDEDDSKKSSDASDYSSSFESQSSNSRQQSRSKLEDQSNRDNLKKNSTQPATCQSFTKASMKSYHRTERAFSPSNIIDEECTAVLDSLSEDDSSRNNGELENSAIVSKSQPFDTRQQSRSKLEDQLNRDNLKKNSTQPATCQSYTKASMKSFHRTEHESRPEDQASKDTHKKSSSKSTICKVSAERNQPSNSEEVNNLDDLKSFIAKKFMCISQQLGIIQSDINALKGGFRRLKQPNAPELASKEKQRSLILPFSCKEDFLEFDNALKEEIINKKYDIRQEIKDTVWVLTSTDKNLIQNLTAVLSKFFTANAINQFTAIKPTGEKGVFKDTQFSSYLLRILRDDLGSCGVTFKDKEYFDGIGRVINNAKSWST